jgi:nitroreductase
MCVVYINITHITHMNITEALNWRYATKVFDTSKELAQAHIDTILEAGRLAPTSYGLQPFRIIQVADKELRAQMKGISYGQGQVTDAGTLFVVAIRTDINDAYIDEYIARIAETREISIEALEGYADMMKNTVGARSQEDKNAWSAKQSYIALGTMIAAASELQIDTCPMEGFDTKELDTLLGLQEMKLQSVAYLAVGYRSQDDTTAQYKKVRLAQDDFVIVK